MGHSVFGGMQRLNIEAARRHAGQDLQTPIGLPPPISAGGSGTPISLNTPDILNSLISITNPFFDNNSSITTSENATQGCTSTDADEPQDKKIFATLETPSTSKNNLNLFSTSISLGGNGFTSHQLQLQLPPSPPPLTSVQSMRSQLIKEGLKLTIQTKRKNSGKEDIDLKSDLVAKRPKREEVELTYDFSISNDSYNESLSPTKLTPEDEERRRRRRERNKVAATKCRNKKKEKTGLLLQESDILESDNVILKNEIARLEAEQQRLAAALEAHSPSCTMNAHQNLKPISNHTNAMMGSPYDDGSGNDYLQNQNSNPHLAINTHHSHSNPYAVNNSNNNMNMNYFNQIHHQPIQLS